MDRSCIAVLAGAALLASASSAMAGPCTKQISSLEQQIKQLQEQITGLAAQLDAKGKETALIDQELSGVRQLWQKNLVQLNRLTSLERDEARLQGERGQLVAGLAVG